jgi:hypothetical protein
VSRPTTAKQFIYGPGCRLQGTSNATPIQYLHRQPYTMSDPSEFPFKFFFNFGKTFLYFGATTPHILFLNFGPGALRPDGPKRQGAPQPT